MSDVIINPQKTFFPVTKQKKNKPETRLNMQTNVNSAHDKNFYGYPEKAGRSYGDIERVPYLITVRRSSFCFVSNMVENKTNPKHMVFKSINDEKV